jgi:hypothetical protein
LIPDKVARELIAADVEEQVISTILTHEGFSAKSFDESTFSSWVWAFTCGVAKRKTANWLRTKKNRSEATDMNSLSGSLRSLANALFVDALETEVGLVKGTSHKAVLAKAQSAGKFYGYPPPVRLTALDRMEVAAGKTLARVALGRIAKDHTVTKLHKRLWQDWKSQDAASCPINLAELYIEAASMPVAKHVRRRNRFLTTVTSLVPIEHKPLALEAAKEYNFAAIGIAHTSDKVKQLGSKGVLGNNFAQTCTALEEIHNYIEDN